MAYRLKSFCFLHASGKYEQQLHDAISGPRDVRSVKSGDARVLASHSWQTDTQLYLARYHCGFGTLTEHVAEYIYTLYIYRFINHAWANHLSISNNSCKAFQSPLTPVTTPRSPSRRNHSFKEVTISFSKHCNVTLRLLRMTSANQNNTARWQGK